MFIVEHEEFKYYAFISYSHKDQRIAKNLQKRLEKYHLPAALHKKHPGLPKKLSPVFIDELDLVGLGTLKESLQEKLNASNYLIVICSPNSAKSEYVNDEVSYFIKKGRTDHIIPFIVGGEPHAKDSLNECFPPAILELPREDELLGIDLKTFGEHDSFIRIIATLLKLNIDDFIARNARERRIKRIIFASAAAVLLIIARMLMPPPYADHYADYVFKHSLVAYSLAGEQYERLSELTDCAINEPDKFPEKSSMYRINKQTSEMLESDAEIYLSDMMKTGEVISWSGKPMHNEECLELLQLSRKRQPEYELLESVLEFVMSDDYAKRYYGKEYPEQLKALLETDADIASELYQIVCSPHLTGKYADGSTDAKGLEGIFEGIPKQNEHLTGEDVKQSKESLARLKGVRRQYLSRIQSSGALNAYKLTVKASELSPIVSDEIHADIQTETESEDQSEKTLLNDLLGYIYHSEIIHSDILWVLDYFESFDREKNWENLQLARAALSIAKKNIAAHKLHAKNTIADRRSFMKRGIDPSPFENLERKFRFKQNSLMIACQALNNNIMFHVFLKDNWEDQKYSFGLRRKYIDYEMRTLADIADYVLADINKPEVTEKFSRILEENCPMTYTYHRKKPDTRKNIEASLHENVRQYGEAALEMSQLLGAENNRLNIMLFEREKGIMNPNASENIADISDMPVIIPMPLGFRFRDIDINYFWKNDDGSVQETPRARSKLERIPDTCLIRKDGVTSEDMRQYQALLKHVGLPAARSVEENGKLSIIYIVRDSTFLVSWEKGTFTIFMPDKILSLVPAGYFQDIRRRNQHVQ